MVADAPALDPLTEEFLAELDEMRRAIQGLGFFSRGRRRELVERSEARQSQLLASVGLVWPRRSHDMSDPQFAAFAHAVRLAREVS